MDGIFAITVLAAASAAAVPPPPPPSVPIIVREPPSIVERSTRQVRTTFDVAISAGRETLWSGSLRVGAGGASYNETIRQAEEPCRGDSVGDEGYGAREGHVLSFTINRSGPADGFSTNTRWQRPAAACEGGGTRGISLEQRLTIAPGQTVRLTGDSGLVVAITRRGS